jgi:hypothetical protein
MAKAPIACTLSTEDYKARVAELRAVSQWLKDVQHGEGTVHLTYDPVAARRVRDLVQKEQLCCAFLRFEMREEESGFHLTITAPEEVHDTAEVLFENFTKVPA